MNTEEKSTQNTSRNAALLAMLREIWDDCRAGRTEYGRLDMGAYARRHVCRQVPRFMVAALLARDTPPTEADAEWIKVENNAYVNSSRRRWEGADTGTVEGAIALLKGRGYRVRKKTTAYIDL